MLPTIRSIGPAPSEATPLSRVERDGAAGAQGTIQGVYDRGSCGLSAMEFEAPPPSRQR
jgi:hypothetical protein